MGKKRKARQRSVKKTYKSNATVLNDILRKRKHENVDEEEVVSDVNRPRPAKRIKDATNKDNLCLYESTNTFHELETVALEEVVVVNKNTDVTSQLPDADTGSSKIKSTPGGQSIVQREEHQTEPLSYSIEKEIPLEEEITIGRRIINLSQFLEKLSRISTHGPLDCGFSSLQLVSEKLNGLSSKFTFVCKMCKKRFVIESDSDDCMPINACAVAATISIGCGHSQLQEFSSGLNLPVVSQKIYQRNHKLLSKNWEKLAQQSMDQAAEEERNIAIAEGNVAKDGTPVIDVISDGVYGKRSYKKNYSALSGAAAIIGRKTGKILYLGVRNKYCYHCDRAEKKKIAATEHFCCKNYSGPSTGMESDIIVEGFKQSVPTHGLIYGRLISDGDANTYSKILQARPYKDITVEKVECRNHLLRNFCNKVQSLQTETKYLISHRKLLTTPRIMIMRSKIKKAIKKNKNDQFPEEQNLFDDILQAHHHAFGNHLKCKSHFCEKTGKLEQDDIPKDFLLSSLWQRISILIENIAGHARSLLHDVDSNVVERYHSVIAKYVGGKRVNFSLKDSYQTRCTASAVSFNEKNPLSKLYKQMTKKSPRGNLKMIEDRRNKSRMLSKRYKKTKRRLPFTQKKSDENYGQECEKPDVPEEIYQRMKTEFLNNLKKTDEERAMIERKTILQRANGEWLEMRRSLLTASNFSRVIKRRLITPCANLVKDILYKKKLDHVESISHGQHNEKTALAQLASQECIVIRPCGLFIDPELCFLGASPDGLVGQDAIVEIKCPLTASKMGLNAAIDAKKVNFWVKNKTGQLSINKKHAWYFQVQGQLHVTQKKYCLFAVWESESEKVKTEKIARDDTFWDREMKEKLIKFYMDCLLPEILDPRLARNMKIREPYIKNQNNDENKNENKEGKEDNPCVGERENSTDITPPMPSTTCLNFSQF